MNKEGYITKAEYIRRMQWNDDVLSVTDSIKSEMMGKMEEMVLDHFDADMSDLREYMHDKIKWEQKQWAAMPKWIPVTERLPEDDTIVLVVSPLYRNPYPAFQIGGVWYDSFLVACQAAIGMKDEETIDNSGITHWMPLPEPPKMDKEEDSGNEL